jgi:hypothetical protein
MATLAGEEKIRVPASSSLSSQIAAATKQGRALHDLVGASTLHIVTNTNRTPCLPHDGQR